ncbi:hypothetical protein Tco_0455181 [Tanacetum coccineum]
MTNDIDPRYLGTKSAIGPNLEDQQCDDDTIAFLHLFFCNSNELLGRDGCHPSVSWRGITTSCLQPWRRKNTLLKDYNSIGKSFVFIDKNIGEQNEELGGFDNKILRSQREMRASQSSKRQKLTKVCTELEEAGVEVQVYHQALYAIVVVTVVVGHLLRPLDIGLRHLMLFYSITKDNLKKHLTSCCSKIDIVPEHNFKELQISFTGGSRMSKGHQQAPFYNFCFAASMAYDWAKFLNAMSYTLSSSSSPC